MTETIRVVWVAAPFKLHLYESVTKFFPQNIDLRVVSATLGYSGKVPFLKRYSRGIWFLPRRELLLRFKEFQPDILRLFEDILLNGSDLRVRVTGRSMMPFLKGGEVLMLRQMPCTSLKKGDLILYRDKNDLPVLHRIIQKTKGDDGTFRFLTKGDALMGFDEEIHGGSVLGKVLLIERPEQAGKTKHIDMNSLFYRCMNLSIAVAGFFKAQTCFFLSGVLAKRT